MVTVSVPEAGRPYALVIAEGEAGLDALDFDTIHALFKAHGAVLVRGLAADVDAFRRFTDPFCSQWVINDAPNRTMIDPAHVIQSVDGGNVAFPPHSEISRAPWRPDICFFYCIQPPEGRGETLVCDGVAVVRALPEAVRAGLAKRRLLYMQPARPAELAYWLGSETPDAATLAAPPPGCPFSFAGGTNGVVRVFSRPALQPTLFGDEPAFANFLLFARDMHKRRDFPRLSDGRAVPDDWVEAIRESCAACTVAVEWQAGDLLILDNSRFMHGRSAIDDVATRVIASRFGYLRDAPVNPEEPVNPVWRREPFIPPGT